ncbi:MAG: DUF4870 domain-containing protein [Candidatus Pacearchaeota archaeon]
MIIYKSREDKIDKEHARRALNWNLSFLIYSATIPIFILVLKVGLWAGLIAFAFGVAHIAFSFIAANKAKRGQFWDIPLSINFVSVKKENRIENDKEN